MVDSTTRRSWDEKYLKPSCILLVSRYMYRILHYIIPSRRSMSASSTAAVSMLYAIKKWNYEMKHVQYNTVLL